MIKGWVRMMSVATEDRLGCVRMTPFFTDDQGMGENDAINFFTDGQRM